MGDKPSCNWKGASGKVYTHYIYALPYSFNEDQDGNYIYAKTNSNNAWVPIYIGQGDLGNRIGSQHHKADCIQSKGATHVHVHLNSNEQSRLDEESDLLARFTNAYAPDGCNEKLGG